MGRGSKRAERGEDAQAAGHRHARLQQLLHEELSSLLRDEAGDPRLGDLAITGVVLSPDYRNARVAFLPEAGAGVPSRAAVDELERALARAAPFLRARLVDALDLKVVPQLRFVFDLAADEDRRAAVALGRERE